MKTAVSIPQDIYESAEKLAKQLGKSRSQLYARALKSYLESQNSERITNQLNATYNQVGSVVNPMLRKAQARSLSKDEW